MKIARDSIGLRIVLLMIAAALFLMANPMQVQAGCTGTPIYFNIYDGNAPVVELEGPPNSSLDTNGIVNFRFNVTDKSNVTSCSLVLNGTVRTNLSDVTRNVTQHFNESGVPEGTWDWYVNCSDMYNHTGQSDTWILKVDYPENTTNETLIINETVENAEGQFVNATIELIDLGSGEVDAVTTSGKSENISAGIYDILIVPEDMPVHEMRIHNYTVITNVTDVMDVDNFTDTTYDFVNAFAIEPKITGYGYINITTTAATGDTLICEEWNFTTRTCPGFRWKKIGNYPPGENYTIQHYNGTAGFVESNYTINLLDIDYYMINNSQTVINEAGSIVDALLLPENNTILNITVSAHNRLNRSNDLRINDIDNKTGWAYNLLVDPSGLNFINTTLTKIANGTSLWKCENYSYEDEICEEDLIFVMDITPGQTYYLIVNATDPVFIEQPDDLEGVDTFVNELAPDTNYGTNRLLRVENSDGNTMRALIRWNVSGLAQGLRIDSAVMELYRNAGRNNDLDVDIVRVTEPWSESTVTWNTMPAYDSTVYNTTTVSGTNGFYAWNITELVKVWYDSTYENYGLYAKAAYEQNGSTRREKRFGSSDSTTAAQRPRLLIEFGPAVTLESPAQGHSVDSATAVNVTFNCSARTAANLTNISLYITDNNSSNFSLNDSVDVVGTSNSSAWTLLLDPGSYTWNCMAFDSEGKTAWGYENRTVSVQEEVPPAPPSPGGGGGGAAPTPYVCVEDWECGPWEPCFNGKHIRNCTDLNDCGTKYAKPVTEQACHYVCTPEWNCTNWTACTPEGLHRRNCTDLNDCRILRGRPATLEPCEYDFCHDGIKNNGEEDIDCGGMCESCRIIELPRILEIVESNILCLLLPILEIALLIMIIMIRASKLIRKHTRRFAWANVIMMVLIALLYVPFMSFTRGACMAIADHLTIINEILLFFSVLFLILLTESIIYLILKHMNRLKQIFRRKQQRKKKIKAKERQRLLLIIFFVMLTMTLIVGPAIFYKYIVPASGTIAEGAEVQVASPMPEIRFYVRFGLVLFVIFTVVALALRWVLSPYIKELKRRPPRKDKKTEKWKRPRK